MIKIFSKINLLFNNRFLVKRKIWKFINLESKKSNKYDVIVDIGGGESPYKKMFKCSKFIIFDIENRTGEDNVILGDINEGINLPDNFADLVLMTEVLEHLKDPELALKEVYRILKKGGKLILTTPHVWPFHEEPNDFFRYTPYSLEFLLKNVGFIRFKIGQSNSFTYTVCQLMVAQLKNAAYKPIIFFINFLAILFFDRNQNSKLPLINEVYAEK